MLGAVSGAAPQSVVLRVQEWQMDRESWESSWRGQNPRDSFLLWAGQQDVEGRIDR